MSNSEHKNELGFQILAMNPEQPMHCPRQTNRNAHKIGGKNLAGPLSLGQSSGTVNPNTNGKLTANPLISFKSQELGGIPFVSAITS